MSAGGEPIHAHHGRAADADVVLQRDPRPLDLARTRRTAELPAELGALRQAGGSEGVALGDQPTRRVHHRTGAAVGGGLGLDQPVALALDAEPERLVGDQLVGAEAVVELDDVDVRGAELRLLIDLSGRARSYARRRR